MAEAPQVIRGYLVVRSDGTMRCVKRSPMLMRDEVGFPIKVVIPRLWGRMHWEGIEVVLPDSPPMEIEVGEPELSKHDLGIDDE